MNRKVLMALLGCLAVVAMLGVPALADQVPSLGVTVEVSELSSVVNPVEVPIDPGRVAVTGSEVYWCMNDNAEAAVPVDPGSVSFESPSQDYISDFKLGVLVVGCVGCSLIGGCYSLRS